MKRHVAITAIVMALSVIACSAQPETAPARLTIDSTMARGPASAPVGIVEFSDYQ